MNKSSKKILSFVLAFISCFALITAISFSAVNRKNNQANAVNEVSYYYGSKLSGTDLCFYNALEEMLSSGKFKKGESLTITDEKVLSLAKAYASGDSSLLQSFGSAVDSFKYDHPDVFYIDYDLLTISVGLKNKEYVVSIGSGRTDTYFVSGVTAENVESMIDTYNKALENLTSGLSGKTTKEKAQEINSKIISLVTYGFGSNSDGSLNEKAPFIRSSYGALIYGEAVCAGYANLFKSAMDKLGENVVLVSGYALDGNRVEPHMWNYIKVDENWLGVDVTWNDGEWTNVESNEKYLLVDKTVMDAEHLPDPVISSSNYNMPYPELDAEIEYIVDGKFEVERYVDKTGTGNDYLNVSYDGKGATELVKEGLYLSYRNKNGDEWTPWFTFEYSAYAFTGLFENKTGYSRVLDYALNGLTVSSYQIAVINKKPNLIVGNSFPVIDGQKVEMYSHYSSVSADDIICLTDEYFNENYDETYVAPPYVKSVTPEDFFMSGHAIGTYHITVTYDQKLKITDGSNTVKMNFNYSAKNGREIIDSEIRKYAKIENVKFDGESTISFDFTPSSMFMHNDVMYIFYFENLVGDVEGKVGKAPNTFGTSFSHPSTSCAGYVYSGNCKSMSVYAQPLLIGNDDLSLEGWSYIDKDGNKKMASQNQISQLALVVTKPNDESEIKDEVNNLAGKDATLATETYDINLNLCGGFTYIPNGMKIKISLGFPAGYSAEDKGVTFKVYHFKRNDDGTLDYSKTEEVDCVITEYGLVITVDNFSPFAVVALDASKVENTKKGIVTNFNGIGGSVTNSLSSSSVNFLTDGENITYSFNLDSGYEIDYVVLNGVKQNISENKLTLSYDSLNENNTLNVGYVSSAIVNEEKKNGIQDLTSNYLTENNEHTHISSTPADCMHKQVCDICGEEFGELGSHKIVTDYYQAPTCTKTGLSAGSHCSVCEKVIVAQIVLSKVNHVDKNGDYKCDNCGQVLEHTHTSTIPADCLHKQVCDICGEEFGELGEHNVVEDKEVKATCQKTGLTAGSHCSVCGLVIKEQTETPKTGHIDEDGDLKCDTCGKELEHTHTSKTPADCLHKQVCDICGEEFGELGSHKIVTDYYQAPTCTKDGLTPGSHCSVCGKVIFAQRVIAKKGHTIVIDEAVPATCTEYGKSIGSHCSECGEVLTKQTPTPKAPHIDNDNDNKCDICGNKVTEDPNIEPQEDKMPAKDIVLIVLSIVGFVVIFALVIAILKPKKKK